MNVAAADLRPEMILHARLGDDLNVVPVRVVNVNAAEDGDGTNVIDSDGKAWWFSVDAELEVGDELVSRYRETYRSHIEYLRRQRRAEA